MRLRSLFPLLFLLLLTWVSLSACGDGEMKAGVTPVTLSFSVPSKSFAPAPESVTRVEVQVTDAAGAEIVLPVSQEVAAGHNVAILLEVPSGPARIFRVTALDAQGEARFEGSSDPVDLQPGLPTTVSVPMQAGPEPPTPNQPPVAAGISQSQTFTGTVVTVTLDGSDSSDPDGDPITFAWVQTAGPPVSLSNSTDSIVSFEIDVPPAGAVLEFQLTVSDGAESTFTPVTVTLLPTKIGLKLDPGNNMRDAVPGGTLFFPHTVTNTGSGSDRFLLSANNDATGTADDFNFDAIRIFADTDADGLLDTPAGGPQISDTGDLAPGAAFAFLVEATVPSTATFGTGVLTVTATSSLDLTSTTSVIDIAVVSNASLSLTKTIDTSSGLSPSGPYTYTLTYANVGNVDVTNLQITDVIPAGMTYVSGSGRWSITGTTPLTDSATDVEGIPGSNDTIHYLFDNTPNAENVTAVIGRVAVGQGGTLSFQVMLDSGLAPGTTLLNSGLYFYPESAACPIAASPCETNRSALTVTD